MKSLPWNDDDLAPETKLVLKDLAEINKHGFLTINSQPCVNAASSSDKDVGWGGPGGYIYQKVCLVGCIQVPLVFLSETHIRYCLEDRYPEN